MISDAVIRRKVRKCLDKAKKLAKKIKTQKRNRLLAKKAKKQAAKKNSAQKKSAVADKCPKKPRRNKEVPVSAAPPPVTVPETHEATQVHSEHHHQHTESL